MTMAGCHSLYNYWETLIQNVNLFVQECNSTINTQKPENMKVSLCLQSFNITNLYRNATGQH